MKKLISILLILSLVLSAFISCNGDVDEKLFETGNCNHEEYKIQNDGSWKCARKSCGVLLKDTDKPYITVLTADGQPTDIIPLTANKDVGEGKITVEGNTITYTNTSGTAQNVVIRSNSFELTLVIVAPTDTCNHYGFGYISDIKKINAASYHEFGTVGRLKVAEGHVVVENGGVVFCAMEVEETGNIENNNGKIYTETTKDANNGNESVTQKENGVFEAVYLDCGYGHHNMQKLVVDSSHTYEVCTACGYTVKVAGVDESSIVYHTSDDKNAVVKDPEVTIDATSGEVTVDTTNVSVPIIAGDVDDEIDVEQVNNCEHSFVFADVEGMCVGTCSKCELKVTQEHHYWDLDGENQGEGAKCVLCNAEPISGVCRIGGTGYDTLESAVAAVPTDGIEKTIVMIANYGFTSNEGVTIGKDQNVVLDLNGFVLGNNSSKALASALVTVKNGTLKIKDSSDKKSNGTGSGRITTSAKNADSSLIPGYANNTITVDGGKLILESGIIEVNAQNFGAVYCVDLLSSFATKNSEFEMGGGRLICNNGDQAVRLFNSSHKNLKCVFTMTNGVIQSGGFWLQQGGNSSMPSIVNISGGTVNGFIDLACYNIDEQKVTISGNAIINASGLRIRKWGNSHPTYEAAKNANALTQTTDPFVFVKCKEFNIEAFDSNDSKNYTQALEYKTFITVKDAVLLGGVASQLR